MMNTVRDTLYSIGDRSGDLARSVGSGTVDLARRFGDGTVDLARQIGPRRALIGVAIAAVAITGTVLVLRYLRTRRAENALGLDNEIDQTGRGTGRVQAPGSEARISY
jgi:hypothetical protein